MKKALMIFFCAVAISATAQINYIESYVTDSIYALSFDANNFHTTKVWTLRDTTWMQITTLNQYHTGQPSTGMVCVDDTGRLVRVSASYYQIPVASMMPYAGALAPNGYLLCDGSAVSRTTYAALFAVVGTTYGAGNGTTTFNLPDCRGRFFLGVSTSGTGSTLGATGGSIDHTHTVDPPNTTSATPTGSPTIGITLLGAGSAASTTHTHDVNISQFSSGSENPPFIAGNYIIKY